MKLKSFIPNLVYLGWSLGIWIVIVTSTYFGVFSDSHNLNILGCVPVILGISAIYLKLRYARQYLTASEDLPKEPFFNSEAIRNFFETYEWLYSEDSWYGSR